MRPLTLAAVRDSVSNLPEREAAEFRRLLREYGLQPQRYVARERKLVAAFGPPVALVLVAGEVEASYSRAGGGWLDQFESDLREGLYGGGLPA